MCQINNKPLNKSEHIGYRVYFHHDYITTAQKSYIRSWYYNQELLPLNERREAATYEPFHAFFDRESLLEWIDSQIESSPTLKKHTHIFEARLDTDLITGTWEDTPIRTITGRACTLLREVTEEFINVPTT